jgi:nucleotide-binding universal stress UspA family protein
MLRSILVPVDSSNFAEHALPYALGIARRTGAEIHLCLVHVPSETVSPHYPLAKAAEAHDAEVRHRDATYVKELVRRLEPSGVTIRPVLLRGYVAAALARYVEDQSIDLVVMTTHGRGGLQRAWLGSTADSLLRHSMIPLLLLRPSEQSRDIGPDSDCELDSILASLDGSDTAETALRDALGLGITRNARVTLAHVLQPPVAAASPYLPHTIQLTHDEMEVREVHMKRYLEDQAASDWMGDRPVRTRVLVDYHPAPAILDLAEDVDADLLVLGTHGRGGLRRLILGSVADKVIRGTHRPVLVHRGVGRIARLAHPHRRPDAARSAASAAEA